MQEKTTFDYVFAAIQHYRTRLGSRARSNAYGQSLADAEVIRNPHGEDMDIRFQIDPARKSLSIRIDGTAMRNLVGLDVFVDTVRFGIISSNSDVVYEAGRLQNAAERQQFVFALAEMDALSNQIEEIFRNILPKSSNISKDILDDR